MMQVKIKKCKSYANFEKSEVVGTEQKTFTSYLVPI